MAKKYYPVGTGMTRSRTKLGKFLRKRRLWHDFKQTKVAKAIGMSQANYSKLEIGDKKYLNPDQIDALAKVLNCNTPEFMKLVRYKPGSHPRTKLAKIVDSRMKELGLTQKQLAERAQISPGHARILRTRSRRISYRLVGPLSEALELDSTTLLKFAGVGKKGESSEPGRLIRFRRREKHLSGCKFAEMLGVTRQNISQIELGKDQLSNEVKIEKMAKILELDVVKLRYLRPGRKLRQKRVDPDTLSGFFTLQRLKKKLTQKQLEKLVGLTSCTVSRIERGVYEADSQKHRDVLNQMLKFFKCEMPKVAIR